MHHHYCQHLATSSKYHIKLTQLADLPDAMYGAYIAVQDRKIYVSGGISPVEDAQHQVFVYETDNDNDRSLLCCSSHYWW